MTKVRASLLYAALLLGACGEAPEEPQADPGQFGSSYDVVTNEHDALPDEPPTLFGDTLVAHVVYSGGCRDHDFELHSEVSSDTARLWLRHASHGDDCEASINERIETTVPPDVMNAGTILLLNPNASEPFVIRWGQTPGGAGQAAE